MSRKKKMPEDVGASKSGNQKIIQLDSNTDQSITPVKFDAVMDFMRKTQAAAADQRDIDACDEIMDMLTDYNAGMNMGAASAGVIVKDKRMLCASCGRKLIPGDKYCAGCGGKLNWKTGGRK